MKRILLTGSAGAGKSTFARALSSKIDVPAFHLDYYFHQKGKNYEQNKEAWTIKVRELLDQDQWIMEGNYSSTYEERFALADTLIFLDISTAVTLWSIFKRRIIYRKKKRPEMPTGWKEKLNWPFVKYVIFFKRDSRKKLVSEIEKYTHDAMQVHVFRSRKQAYNWLCKL